MRTTIVVAMAPDGGIGLDGELPWVSSADMRFFYEETTRAPRVGARNAVIMGRATWESLPRALRGRLNVVVSARWSRMSAEDIARESGAAPDLVAASVAEALEALEARAAREGDVGRAFAIGGEGVFAEALALSGDRACEEMVVTHVLQHVACDRWFPMDLARAHGFAEVADSAEALAAFARPIAPAPAYQPPVEIRRYARAPSA